MWETITDMKTPGLERLLKVTSPTTKHKKADSTYGQPCDPIGLWPPLVATSFIEFVTQSSVQHGWKMLGFLGCFFVLCLFFCLGYFVCFLEQSVYSIGLGGAFKRN